MSDTERLMAETAEVREESWPWRGWFVQDASGEYYLQKDGSWTDTIDFWDTKQDAEVALLDAQRGGLYGRPAWRAKPTGPGVWLCKGSEKSDANPKAWFVLVLSQKDLDDGRPFCTTAVYGPIPPTENGDTDEHGASERGV